MTAQKRKTGTLEQAGKHVRAVIASKPRRNAISELVKAIQDLHRQGIVNDQQLETLLLLARKKK